jgi:hypothetical protein
MIILIVPANIGEGSGEDILPCPNGLGLTKKDTVTFNI